MKVSREYDYRNAKGILQTVDPNNLDEIYDTLNDPNFKLRFGAPEGKKQNLSRQIQEVFREKEWNVEHPHLTLPDLHYDLYKGHIPVEIEIGHERLVYADFFKFLVDYSAKKIPAALMVVTFNPEDFGHKWPNSLANLKSKIFLFFRKSCSLLTSALIS